MDGDARRPLGPQEITGYSVHLGYAPAPAPRTDARPAQAPATPDPPREKPDAKQPEPKKDDETKGDEAKDDKANDGKEDDKDDKKEEKPPTPRWKKVLYGIVGLLVLAALVTVGVLYWLHSRHYETTDDAFIDGNISQVSAQVAARVIRLAINDNQLVRAGDLLIELDARDYQVKLDQAQAQRAQIAAQLEQARAGLLTQQASLDQAAANVRVTEADLGQAQTDFTRYRSIDPKAITRQQVDTASATVKSAQARLDANRQAVAGAQATMVSQRAQVKAAEANLVQADVAVENAQLQLSYVRIVAPRDGRVTRRTVELGNYVNPGQSLLAIVGTDLWVTANYKETQLGSMKVGQYVRIRVDSCPDEDFDAKVDSFQSGSGSIFSSLPAENATGNYVKVVQRVPVKIVFDDRRSPEQRSEVCRMAPGMSVAPRVTVR